MSRKMLERYSHIRMKAKREAVAVLDRDFVVAGTEGSHPHHETQELLQTV
jgi:hypothetical protein